MSKPSAMTEQTDDVFYFLSAHRSLKAAGIHSRLNTPVKDRRFQTAVSQAFAHARAAGIDQPVLMGAIPFDMHQPSELFIPSCHGFFDRAERLEAASRRSAAAGRAVSARSTPDEPGFKSAVSQAIARFRHGDIRKAVLSRVYEVEFAEPLAADQIFDALCRQNPHGYQFQLPLAAGGHLVGVSPELLLRKHGASVHTFPLAGSAKRQADAHADQAAGDALLQSAKDHYEHSLVIEDIRSVLAPHCVELSIPDAPSLLGTRAMWHLGTPIEGRLADPAMTALKLACLLHPTPAICGFPTAAARELIGQIEPFQRGVFSGMVGWCDEEGNGEWAVTIRCATVAENRAQLFAGAGIVAASTPESEWAETQAKLGTMLSAFGLTGMEALA
ncbi:isochorismate synthase [Chromobacterium amazonense]|uniref:isochorismate synthase n=1 Tax=Chromobacterium amazonense TaxID=1382803 RepID=A0ABU8V1Y2_9NEIS|nr:isochorismate synthase [Chromobacterium amazonense]MDQ4539486.1 isochorismate synthase [Chromobacterium amazonense]